MLIDKLTKWTFSNRTCFEVLDLLLLFVFVVDDDDEGVVFILVEWLGVVVDVAITGICSAVATVLLESIVYSKLTDVADAGKLDKSM